jgi:Mn-dependent DtxR family transcriptional regulator
MIPEDLTAALAETLRVYKALADAGSPPTVRQLAEELGISRAGANVRLRRLRELGYLTMPPITQTRLRVTAKGKKIAP